MNAAKPVGLEDLLELVLDDCLVDLCWILKMPQVSELDSVIWVPGSITRFARDCCSLCSQRLLLQFIFSPSILMGLDVLWDLGDLMICA